MTLPESSAPRAGLILGVSNRDSVGYHCAKLFTRQGQKVAVSYRDRPGTRGPEIADELKCLGIPLEVGDPSSVRSAVTRIEAQFERLDFIVHTLVHVPDGILSRPVYELGRDDFLDVLDVAVYSLIDFTRAALPLLERSPAPRIVAMLSAGADFALPNYHAVGIAKAALAATLRYLARDLGEHGVLCNGLSFSMLETSAAKRVIGPEVTRRTAEHIAKRSLTGQQLKHEHVARTAAFLAGADCQNLTGEILTVDGGYRRGYF